MLKNPVVDKLLLMKLPGMVAAWEEQTVTPETHKLGFDDRFGLLVDAEYTRQETGKLEQRLKRANLKDHACIEDLDYKNRTGLDRVLVAELATGNWVREALNVLITGPTGIGKTYVACALANKVCRLGFSVLYFRATRLLQELTVARLSGKSASLLSRLAKTDLIVMDDFALAPLTDDQSRDLLEIVDDRCAKRPIIMIGQVPLPAWYESIPNATLADAILDRVVHSSYKITLHGDSYRKRQKKDTDKKD